MQTMLENLKNYFEITSKEQQERDWAEIIEQFPLNSSEIIINNDIEDTYCELYSPDDEYLGDILNNVALSDVRLQIARKRLDGYYIKFENIKYTISNKGKLDYPSGLFSKELENNCELFKIWHENGKDK